jgi:hypothetical protein
MPARLRMARALGSTAEVERPLDAGMSSTMI